MDCFAGIDLGSTTTKAVVVDGNGSVIGRGITNSRSNYDVAVHVAREAAFNSVRFAMLARLLRESQALGERTDAFGDAFAGAFETECYLGQLARLEEHCRADPQIASGHALAKALEAALDFVFSQMRAQALETLHSGASARSDFFRDIAGAAFHEFAASVARDGGPPFDRIVALFDRAIAPVENEPEPRTPQELFGAAYRHIEKRFPPRDNDIRDVLDLAATEPINVIRYAGTGYGRVRLPFPKDCIRSEILCHGLGAHLMFPGTATVLDIGGQDTKAIQVDAGGVVTNFQMNDRCAAGCGRYLGYIADEMNIGLHELGPMALQAHRRVRINSTCTVFAGAELRDRLAAGQRREDIVAGLHRAIILRAISLLARSGGVRDQFTFTGGVAKNPAAVAALRELAEENYGALTLNVAPDSIYTGALGAAHFALRGAAAA